MRNKLFFRKAKALPFFAFSIVLNSSQINLANLTEEDKPLLIVKQVIPQLPL